MPNIRRLVISLFVGLGLSTIASAAPHRVILQGNDRLAILASDGRVEWEMPWGAIHDIHVLENGNMMVQRGPATVVEIDPRTRQVVWAYDSAISNENQNTPVEVHSFQPLPSGRVLIAESGAGRLIEMDREGRLTKIVPLKIDKPHVHHDTRLVRKLESGNFLVCHEADGAVREYAGQAGEVVWEYLVPLFGREPREGHGPEGFGNQVFAALRLENGNTLISTGNGHTVLEITPEKEIAWSLEQHDLPGIVLAWVTTLQVLPSGNYVIGNCHAGPDNPLLVEIEPKTKKVVWKLERFEEFGNSVSNSQLLDVPKGGRR